MDMGRWVGVWVYGCMGGCMGAWVYGWKDRWIDGSMGGGGGYTTRQAVDRHVGAVVGSVVGWWWADPTRAQTDLLVDDLLLDVPEPDFIETYNTNATPIHHQQPTNLPACLPASQPASQTRRWCHVPTAGTVNRPP